MIGLEQLKELARPTPSRIVLLVIDGLGGLPHPETGKTELESADIPNLNQLATEGICGMIDPIAPGITPGSAPGLSLIHISEPTRQLMSSRMPSSA